MIALRRPPVTPGPHAFGAWGGRYAPETLVEPLVELEAAFEEALADDAFLAQLHQWWAQYAGRPTPLWRARRFGEALGGVDVWLKREDLLHTGAHKLNNALGQGLLARRMGKRRVVAETGAGQHGVATATAAAALGLECTVYMGEVDAARQALNVHRMRLLGAQVVGVPSGTRTLKDAINEALRDWAATCDTSHYLIGSVLGPHPFPTVVRTFQSVIGVEARAQMLDERGCLPDVAVACVGGGSNAIGLFAAFLDDEVRLVGVEAAGRSPAPGDHAARLAPGSQGAAPGVLHGTYTAVLQDAHGQIQPTHSVAAGLDYPGVGPEHAWLAEQGRARYVAVSDDEAVEAFEMLSRLEGIVPALESAHALAWVVRAVRTGELHAGETVLINLSGRGDKDAVRMALEGQP